MKLDVRGDHHVLVVLSRRNVLALLHKLTMPGSARTLVCGDNNVNGEPTTEAWLVVQVEDDEEHYGARPVQPGPMHPSTERALAAERLQRERNAAEPLRWVSSGEVSLSGPRLSWTQAICELCWTRRHPEQPPYRLADREAEPEHCGYCGSTTRAGIYVRENPETVAFPRLEQDEG